MKSTVYYCWCLWNPEHVSDGGPLQCPKLPWPLVASRCEWLEFFGRQNFPLAALNQSPNVVGPQGESIADLALVTAAIVDPGDAALVATLMVAHGLDNVRLDSDVGHDRRGRPSQIVNSPALDAAALIERRFALVPGGKAVGGARAEQQIAADELRHRANDGERHRHQRQRVGAAVLAALLRQCPRRLRRFQIEL